MPSDSRATLDGRGLQILWFCKPRPTEVPCPPSPTAPSRPAPRERLADKKRYLWLIGLVVPSLAFIGYAAWAATGWGAFFWIGPVVILVIVPAIDLIAGLDRSNPPDDVIEALEQDRYYRWITYLFLPIQYVGFVGAFYLIANGDPLGLPEARPEHVREARAGRSRSAASAASASTPPTSSATSARRTSAGCPRSRWRRASTATSTSSTTAATTSGSRRPRTRPASRVGENFYQFWPRTVVGLPEVRVEAGEEADRPPRQAPVPDLQRRAQRVADVGGALGRHDRLARRRDRAVPRGPGDRRLLAARGRQLHGALRHAPAEGRRPAAQQRYERVDPTHSWNSNNIATNVLLYHLQRHSDHHANPTRRYQSLRDFEESPVLPTGYAGMIVLAIVPAVWRRVMDPRVLAHFDGDLSRANLSPRKRDKILAKYPPPDASVS